MKINLSRLFFVFLLFVVASHQIYLNFTKPTKRSPSAIDAGRSCKEVLDAMVNLPPNAYAPLEKLGKYASLKESPFGLGKMITYSAPSIPDMFNLKTMKELKIASYNVKNMFGPNDDAGSTGIKPASELSGVAKAIKDMNPSILGVVESGSFPTMQDFADNPDYLAGQYQPLMIYSNSDRNIHTSFFIDKRLALYLEIHSATELMGTYMGKTVKAFSRDCPFMIAWQQGKDPSRDKPLFILGLTHLKSQRPSPGDMNSVLKRTQEAGDAIKFKDIIQHKYGRNIPLFMMGDFNNDILTSSEFDSIRADGMIDSLDSAPRPFEGERITFPDGRRGKQIDAIWISPTVAQQRMVLGSGIYHYPEEGTEGFDPPSDHRPVWTVFDFQKILKQQAK